MTWLNMTYIWEQKESGFQFIIIAQISLHMILNDIVTAKKMPQISDLWTPLSFEVLYASPCTQHQQPCQPWEHTHHTQRNHQNN